MMRAALCALALATLSQASVAASPTFTRDVAPIIFERCTVCHRTGEAAPSTFLNYADVKRRAEQIVKVTQSRYMPPWLPEPGFGAFSGQRRLTAEQIALLERWAAAGAPEGDAKDMPAAPKFADGWQLGQPDLVVTMDAYTLAATGRNVFRNFVIPIPDQTRRRFVKAVEFRPGNPLVLHHAIMRIDRSQHCRRLDEQDPESGFGGMDMGNAQPPDGIFLGWTPGAAPYAGHPGVAWQLEPGTDFVLQLHMVPSGKPEVVRPSIGLYFTDKPPTRDAYALVVQNFNIDIPAGSKDYVVEETFPLAVPVEVLSIYPHAHFLGREMKIFATLPGGETRWLLFIKDWDFNWQDSFAYAEPVKLPKGTVITMRYTYDNSADNPRNPNHPPKRVTFGLESADEMASVTFQLVAATSSDLDTLKESVWRNLLNKNPQDPFALYNLGTELCKHGKLDEGISHLRATVRLNPDYPGASYNLGVALKSKGVFGEAAHSFSEALRVNPKDAAALKSATALAWTLATHPDDKVRDPARAVMLSERAAEVTGNQDAGVLDTLAAAYAAAGRFDDAVRIAEAALPLASTEKTGRLAEGIRGRLVLYRRSTPYRQAL
jgi:hypothetical protein